MPKWFVACSCLITVILAASSALADDDDFVRLINQGDATTPAPPNQTELDFLGPLEPFAGSLLDKINQAGRVPSLADTLVVPSSLDDPIEQWLLDAHSPDRPRDVRIVPRYTIQF